MFYEVGVFVCYKVSILRVAVIVIRLMRDTVL